MMQPKHSTASTFSFSNSFCSPRGNSKLPGTCLVTISFTPNFKSVSMAPLSISAVMSLFHAAATKPILYFSALGKESSERFMGSLRDILFDWLIGLLSCFSILVFPHFVEAAFGQARENPLLPPSLAKHGFEHEP